MSLPQNSLKRALIMCIMVTSSAFTTPTLTSLGLHQQRTNQRSKTNLYSYAINNEDEALRMMMKANICAHSDTCSIDEAENYLNEMLHLQSNCASDSLRSDAICNDVLFPSEVIAGLREKIQRQTEIRNNKLSPLSVGFNPVFLTIVAIYLSSGFFSLIHNNPDAFTMQEWMYALQGGYLDDMVSQYMKYGGLSPITPIVADENSMVVVPITLQEIWWSLRDGYFGRLMTEYQNYGGLLSIVDGSPEKDLLIATPFTSEEWTSALRDGYLPTMIAHYVRNGGL